MTTTPLAYFGGKQKLADRIVALMPEHTVYLEPYAGGAAVFFRKPRVRYEVLNDLDGAVVNFWRVLREDPEALAAAVMETPYSRDEWNGARRSGSGLEAARQFLVSIDQSFGRAGNSWSPPALVGRWQPKSWSSLPAKIVDAAVRLQGVAIENDDALKLLPLYDRAGALIYCDPPYAPSSRRAKTVYTEDATDEDWFALSETLAQLEHAQVIVSGYPCAAMKNLGWEAIPMHALRLSSPTQERAKTEEVLWTNFSLEGRLW